MKTEKFDLRPRMQEFLAAIGMTPNKLEALCGFSKRYLYNVHYCVTREKLERILAILPALNREWLLTGQGDMFNKMLSPSEASTAGEGVSANRNRLDILKRLNVVMEASASTIETYEKFNRISEGTIQDIIMSAEPRVMNAWLIDIMNSFPDYSLEWVLTGRGALRYSELKRLPLITPMDIFRTMDNSALPDDWLRKAQMDSASYMFLPEYVSPECHQLDNGFVFKVPTIGKMYGGGVASPGVYLICDLTPKHPSEWNDGEAYLFLNRKIWCSRLEEVNGFRIEDRDLFVQDYYYLAKDEIISLGQVVGQIKFTSYWENEDTKKFAKQLGLLK